MTVRDIPSYCAIGAASIVYNSVLNIDEAIADRVRESYFLYRFQVHGLVDGAH